jgi:hypothetical protein
MKLSLVLNLAVCTIMSGGLLALQTIRVFAQRNTAQGTNQTGNQTENHSSALAVPGQP